MATDKVRAAARRIRELHHRFADGFGRKEAQTHSMVDLRGLMLAEGRKNVEAMALVTATRWRVEEYFEDGKGELGMADYEARGWRSWHHHMSLVALAHLFVTLTKRDLAEEFPELTLPMAARLLKSTLSRPTLTEAEALRLTEYHLNRNAVARNSHRKSWLRKHKNVKPKPLL